MHMFDVGVVTCVFQMQILTLHNHSVSGNRETHINCVM